jgi:hypothetical protein
MDPPQIDVPPLISRNSLGQYRLRSSKHYYFPNIVPLPLLPRARVRTLHAYNQSVTDLVALFAGLSEATLETSAPVETQESDQ